MFYIFEMANNHMGDINHAKMIIDQFSQIAQDYGINAGIKFQFRQLSSFIHKDFINSDLKYVKRFKETKLSKKEFAELSDYVRLKGLKTVATPFDNKSIKWLSDLDIEVVKVASCSIDDWLLLKDICEINKKIIISTGGASLKTLKKVYNIFKSKNRDFAFLHCVGEYPTMTSHANLSKINILKQEFPDIEIGFSTHESPRDKSMVLYAMAMGCSIIEKHVGFAADLNAYSCCPDDIRSLLAEISIFEAAYRGKSDEEVKTLKKLKRGLYAKRDIKKGEILRENDIYLSMPIQEDQMDASMVYECLGKITLVNIKSDSKLVESFFKSYSHNTIIDRIKRETRELLDSANVALSEKDQVELSCHYGIENFFDVGVLIVSKINREYCKKIIVVLGGQSHPSHRHLRKEESFELLFGDCDLQKDGTMISMRRGLPILIPRGVNHSFKSNEGCVIEEVSTTHYTDDSIYADFNINKLDISDRKININFYA